MTNVEATVALLFNQGRVKGTGRATFLIFLRLSDRRESLSFH